MVFTDPLQKPSLTELVSDQLLSMIVPGENMPKKDKVPESWTQDFNGMLDFTLACCTSLSDEGSGMSNTRFWFKRLILG